MINELLTNTGWITPQIDFLVWLQNLRTATGGIFDDFLLRLTTFGETIVPFAIMCVIYWCFDFKGGIYIFSLNSVCMIIAQFFKISACIYRPWVISDSVHPQPKAFLRAGGYSFPSGHSAMAASSFGGIAYFFRKNIPLCIFLILLVLIVGFSRLYLGVHTPQDVLVGFITGLVFIFLIDFILKKCEKNKNGYLYFALAVNILTVMLLVYACTKGYPMDYYNGKLLANPLNVKYIAVMYGGQSAGLITGAMLCARFFPFNPKEWSLKRRIITGITGVILAVSILNHTQYFWGHMIDFKLAFVITFCASLVLTGLYPFIFTRFKK